MILIMIILTYVNRNYENLNNYNKKIFFNTFNKYTNFILLHGDYNSIYKDHYNVYKKFKDYYIRYFYNKNKLESIKYFNYSGEVHREDGPAHIEYFYNGLLTYKGHYINGKINQS